LETSPQKCGSEAKTGRTAIHFVSFGQHIVQWNYGLPGRFRFVVQIIVWLTSPSILYGRYLNNHVHYAFAARLETIFLDSGNQKQRQIILGQIKSGKQVIRVVPD
jgi:hypothetical protein